MYSNLQIIKQGYFSLLDGLLQDIYKPCDCPACQSQILQLSQGDTSPFKQILNTGEKAFKQLHKNQKYHPRDLDKVKEYQQLITQTSDFLQTTISQDIPKELQDYLKKDVFIFSGLRAHAQLTQARQYLTDSDGVPVPYQQFERNVLKINKQYNRQYLQAEYLFGQQSAQSAANWQNLQDDTDRYLLQYRTAQDDKVRASHQPLHQTTLPKNDPFWNSYYPPNGWRCRCTAVEVISRDYPSSDPSASIEKGETATTQIAKNGQNKLGIFRFNPGKSKVVFPPKHPYNKVVGAKIAKPIILTMFSKGSNTITVIKKYKNGGVVQRYNDASTKESDYKRVLLAAKQFAKKTGKEVTITPRIHAKDIRYDTVYGNLKDTPYYRKCPDLKVGDDFYEHEGFVDNGGNPKRKLNSMLNRGLKQSNKLIIEDGGHKLYYIKKVVNNRIKQGQIIDEVWVLKKNGDLLQVFP